MATWPAYSEGQTPWSDCPLAIGLIPHGWGYAQRGAGFPCPLEMVPVCVVLYLNLPNLAQDSRTTSLFQIK